MSKNIVLVGLMGAGKTSVGKIVSQKIGYEILDTDELIEKKENSSISEIFVTKGEDYFRKLETSITYDIKNFENKVISTGGGMLEKSENIKNLKHNGLLIYLKTSPEILFERIKFQNNRPLLKNDNPLETLKTLLKKREKNYLYSDVIIETDNKSIENIAEDIVEEYQCKQ